MHFSSGSPMQDPFGVDTAVMRSTRGTLRLVPPVWLEEQCRKRHAAGVSTGSAHFVLLYYK
jgi:hypothetical protein